jgi:hypothetical protein
MGKKTIQKLRGVWANFIDTLVAMGFLRSVLAMAFIAVTVVILLYLFKATGENLQNFD